MLTHLFDILKIVFFTSVFGFILSRFPNLTFEGALVVCASVYLILSGWVYRGLGKDSKSLKLIRGKGNDQAFNENDPKVSLRSFQIAGIKLILASLILFLCSVIVFYLEG